MQREKCREEEGEKQDTASGQTKRESERERERENEKRRKHSESVEREGGICRESEGEQERLVRPERDRDRDYPKKRKGNHLESDRKVVTPLQDRSVAIRITLGSIPTCMVQICQP